MTAVSGAPPYRDRPTLKQASRLVSLALIALLALACTTPTALSPTRGTSALPPLGKPERSTFKVGTPGSSYSYLPLFLAAEGAFKDEGLEVELVSFNADGGLDQALVAGAVDIALGGLTRVVTLINAGQPVKAFFNGSSRAEHEWYARPEVASWSDLRGRTLAITSAGSASDAITSFVLRKHGLEPNRDVQLVASGSGPNRLQALLFRPHRRGQPARTIEDGRRRGGLPTAGQPGRGDRATSPTTVISAKEQLLAEAPNTLRAFLRAHVRSVRELRANRERAVKMLEQTQKMTRRMPK